MSETDPNSGARARVATINSVRTPLSMFVLLVLTLEAVLGVAVTKLEAGSDRTFAIQAIVFFLGGVLIVVAAMAVWKPSSLMGKVPRGDTRSSLNIILGPPKDLPNLDLSAISWNDEDCYLMCGTKKYQISLVRSRFGPTFQVRIDSELMAQLPDDVLGFSLKDSKGNRWAVERFFLYDHLLPLSLVEDKSKIIKDYGEEEQ
jgi:hypothetical protein